jgi:arylsulfatase A-like enzyme
MVDWFPTLVALAGGSPEQENPLDGRDIWPVLTEGKPSPHDAILLNTTPATGAIRMGEWKLVLNGAVNANDLDAPAVKDPGNADRNTGQATAPPATNAGTVELFHLDDDPHEEYNLAGARPDKVEELRARLDAFAREAVPPKATDMPEGFRAPRIWGEAD